jgi:hypothetical protein
MLITIIITSPIYYFENYFALKAQQISDFINLDTVYKA